MSASPMLARRSPSASRPFRYEGTQMIELKCIGAALGVTGSKHLLRTPRANVLLDCGMFQGRRKESIERNEKLGFDISEVDVVVLSHAHIDHSGSLPMLYKHGYRGSIYATPATRDLCAVMLEDSAAIQLHDAKWINKKIENGESDMQPVSPLYSQDDVIGVLKQMIGLPYRNRHPIAPGVWLTFRDAGHVLGSAMVELEIDDEGTTRRFLFSGDLGRRNMPILRDPELPSGIEILLCESTYGDRLHPPLEEMEAELEEIVEQVVARKGKVLIPSFALERAQEIIFALKRIHARGKLPSVPVYVDSPLTVRLTEVFRMHPECYDEHTLGLLSQGSSPFDFPGLEYVSDVEQSKQIAAQPGPSVIIAASGMCEFGRIVHHIKSIVDDERSAVVIVGFQAQHTLGRRLVEKRREIRVLGVMRERKFEVRVLNGFSAHADQSDLLAFAEELRDRGPLRQVILVHGEPEPIRSLESELDKRGFPCVHVPSPGDVIRL